MAGTHASKSPSTSERFHACAGYLPAVASLPADMRRGSTKASQMGTAAHFLLERCLTETKPPEDFRDRIIELLPPHEDGSMLKANAKLPGRNRVFFIVDDDMIEGVALAYEYVQRRMVELSMVAKDLQLETRTNPCPERDDTSGTADVTLDAWPAMLEVVDYKNGFMTVEHKDNPQLLAYLAGRAHDTGWGHDHYQITVVQPNARHDEGRVRTFHVTRQELQAFVLRHRAAAERVDVAEDSYPGLRAVRDQTDEGAEWVKANLVAGHHCNMCDFALLCPAKKLLIKSKAGLDFDSEMPTEALPEVVGIEEAVRLVEWKDLITDHLKQAQALVNTTARGGKSSAVKLVRGTSPGRTWRSVAAVRAALTEEFPDICFLGKTIDALMVEAGYIGGNSRAQLFIEPKMVTGPAAEKLVQSKLRRAFSALFLDKPPGRLVAVPASDSREAVVVNAADDFDDYDPEE